MVSPVTPVVALTLGACAPPLYVNDVVVPHVTATDFGLIVHVISFIPVPVLSLHLWFPSGVHVCLYVPAFVALVVPPAVLPVGHVIPLTCSFPV